MVSKYKDIRMKWMESKGFNLMADKEQYDYAQDLLKSPNELRGVFCESPAGTGKTTIAVLAAAYGIEKGDYDRIIYIRGTDIVGDDIGFLPGVLEEKIAPHMSPLIDALDNVKKGIFDKWVEEGKVYATVATYLRGVTFKNAFIILDEVQNMTIAQLQTIYTRPEDTCKIVSIGSLRQIDNENLKRYNGLTPFEVYMVHYKERATFHKLYKNHRGDWSRHGDKVQMTVNELTGRHYNKADYDDKEEYFQKEEDKLNSSKKYGIL